MIIHTHTHYHYTRANKLANAHNPAHRYLGAHLDDRHARSADDGDARHAKLLIVAHHVRNPVRA